MLHLPRGHFRPHPIYIYFHPSPFHLPPHSQHEEEEKGSRAEKIGEEELLPALRSQWLDLNFTQEKMTKVHPNSSSSPSLYDTHREEEKEKEEEPTVLTVWNKSLLFNCRGFTVFDSKGDLVFRVDTYASTRRSARVLLMDAVGRPLLTIRRKRLMCLGEQWVVYDGEGSSNARFSVRKARRALVGTKQGKELARVEGAGGQWGYVVEGSYGNRSCVVYDDGGADDEMVGKRRRKKVAEIKRKEAVGKDVFRLEVEGKADAAAAMAMVVVLEQMFGSR